MLLPALRRYPAAVGQLALSLAQVHREYAEAAAQEPNSALLAEVGQILGVGLETQRRVGPAIPTEQCPHQDRGG